MLKKATIASASALALISTACGDHRSRDGEPRGDTTEGDTHADCTSAPEVEVPAELVVSWTNARGDVYAKNFVGFPNTPERFVRVPLIALSAPGPNAPDAGFDVQTIARLDAEGAVINHETTCTNPPVGGSRSDCGSITTPWSLNAQPGDTLRVTLAYTKTSWARCVAGPDAPVVVDVVLPADPDAVSPNATTRAVAADVTGDGTLWVGLLGYGLFGMGPDGVSVAYEAVPTNEPYALTERRPQTPMLFAVEDAGDGALWIGGATTGISWFHPGEDLASKEDDLWAHVQPVTVEDDPLKELAETTIAIAPSGDSELWIASLSGLHHFDADAPTSAIATTAPGAFLAVTTDDAGTAWAGRSVEPAILAAWYKEGADPYPDAALLAVDWDADAGPTVTPWDVDTLAVTAVATSGDTIYIGTPRGLRRLDRNKPAEAPVAVADETLGTLAITALVVDTRGLWVAARASCAADSGRLVLLDLNDGSIVQDASDAGFGVRDFNGLKALGGGRLFVSTVVPRSNLEPVNAEDCELPKLEDYAGGDAFIFDPASEAAPTPIAP